MEREFASTEGHETMLCAADILTGRTVISSCTTLQWNIGNSGCTTLKRTNGEPAEQKQTWARDDRREKR